MEHEIHEDLLVVEKKGARSFLPAKIICIGDCSVGKTSIICRFVQDRFKKDNQTTLGVEYFKKVISIDREDVLLEIWDTAGQERYRSLVKFFYKNAKGALLVFDLCDKNSFLNLDFWLKSLRMHSDKDLVVVVVGNKCDKTESRQVNEEEVKSFCEENELEFFFTSAKDGLQIKEVFMELGKKVKENQKNRTKTREHSTSSDFSEIKVERGCTICEC